MSTKPFTEFYDEVMPSIPGATPALVLNAIRNAAINFCEQTKVWVIDNDPILSIANEPHYDLDSSSTYEPVILMCAWYDERKLIPKTPGDLDVMYTNWPSRSGAPEYITQEKPSEIILVPYPSSSGSSITAKIAVKPKSTSTGIEKWIGEKYLEGIAHGALAKMMAMPSKPWSDGATSLYHKDLFDNAVAAARLDAGKGFGRAVIRTRPQFL